MRESDFRVALFSHGIFLGLFQPLTKKSQYPRGKIHKERVIIIIPITKDEAQKL